MFGWFWRLARNSDRILRDSFSLVFSGPSNFTKMRWIHCWSSRPVPHPFRLGLAQCTVAGVLGVFAGWIHLGSIPAEDVDFPNGKATGESKKEKLLTFWGSANPKGSKSWLNDGEDMWRYVKMMFHKHLGCRAINPILGQTYILI